MLDLDSCVTGLTKQHMKVLIIGGSGMLGHKLIQVLSRNFETATTIRSEKNSLETFGFHKRTKVFDQINVENIKTVENVLIDFKPDFVINAVGIIKQLPESKNSNLILDINSIFPKSLSLLNQKYNFKLINISTDCVFSGKIGNYNETDISDAEDLYGKSKYLGEVISENCLTIRTSIIGREILTTHSLIEWFLSKQGKRIKGYKKAIYSGFPTVILSEIILNLIIQYPDLTGLFHVSSNPINKFELLNLVKKEFNIEVEIEPFEDFVIDRSLDSTKFRKFTGFTPISWEEMIVIMAKDPTPYEKWRKRIT